MRSIVVREHALLTTGRLAGESSLEAASISQSAFDWLCMESARMRAAGARLVQQDGRNWLRLDNYVGVIETPCRTRIEILPKAFDDDSEAYRARALLRTMLARCLDLKPRETGPASIQAFSGPLTEWVMHEFLEALDRLVKRGLRFDYRSVRERRRYLAGRLDTARQLRQPPGRDHLFNIEHDVFAPDRAENRLLRSALDLVCRTTGNPDNWRRSRELASYMAAIPPSRDVASDFRSWGDDRLMVHYRPVRPWCALILSGKTPLSVLGEWRGRSLLFPMERLFERYVEVCLRRALPVGARLRPSASSEYLCTHRGQRWFRLKPDFIVERPGERWVIDAKWKQLDASLDNARDKYRLSSADFYQLFAYGHRYLAGKGSMFLVYPRTSTFRDPLPEFSFGDGLTLRALPFDLEAGRLSGVSWQSGPDRVVPLARTEDGFAG